MNVLGVVMDPIEQCNPQKDTTLALLLEAQARGWQIEYILPSRLFCRQDRAMALSQPLQVFNNPDKWFALRPTHEFDLAACDVILMRQDPPFDMQYIYATYCLELAEKQGARIINKPQSLRDANEKVVIAQFPGCAPPFVVSQHLGILEDFLNTHEDVVLKPLDSMGGQGIMRLQTTEKETLGKLDAATHSGQKTVMLQRYLPEVVDGDKRILLINGEPVPYALARIPQAGHLQANLAQGGHAEARELTVRDQWICTQLKSYLQEKELFFVGIDIIGDFLTEVNVTSPMGIRQLQDLTGIDIAAQFFDCL
ncbi:MAG: glutathione synthetase [marine bacterium B5-7]|nr:MAG: glutathione synthetase [marine bacterium B5-7]